MNNKIPIVFLMVFILGVVFVFYNYSISLEKSLESTSQLLTSQGKTELEIDSTLSMMESQHKRTFLKDILILFFGVFIGAIPTFILYRQQLIKQNKEAEIKIISDTLYYIFKSKTSANNLLTDKSFVDQCRKEWPNKINQAEKEMYLNYDNEIKKDFFPDLMLHSFHLRRLSDKSFSKDFENLMNIYENYTKMILDQKPENELSTLEKQFKSLMKQFVEKCIKKAKINL